MEQAAEKWNSQPVLLKLSLLIFEIFIQFLKVIFHLQLLQNISYIPCVVQYILEPILYPIVYTFHSPTPILPLRPNFFLPFECFSFYEKAVLKGHCYSCD